MSRAIPFPLVPGRGSGDSYETVTDWDDRPEPTEGALLLYEPTGVVYAAHVEEGVGAWWVPPEVLALSPEHVATIVGTENSDAELEAHGYTVSKSNGGFVQSVTIGGAAFCSLDTSAGNSATYYLTRSVTSGDGRYYAGHYRLDYSGAAVAGQSSGMIPWLDDGTRIYHLDGTFAANAEGARWANGSGGAGIPVALDMSAVAWTEVFIAPSGTAYARRGHSAEWTSIVGASQLAASTSAAEYIGDSAGGSSATSNFRDFTILNLPAP